MFRERLTDFYRSHNPACLDSIDEILEIFDGREEELFRVLEEKYADVHCNSQRVVNYYPPIDEPDIGGKSTIKGATRQVSYAEKCLRNINRDAESHNGVGVRNLTELHSFCNHAAEESAVLVDPRENSVSVRAQAEPLSKSDERDVLLLREENGKLKASNYALRCEVVVLKAEKEALARQRSGDEETMSILRAHIAHHDCVERELIEKISVCELKGKAVLSEHEFASIIAASQERLRQYYEDKISFMQMEIDTFYKHAAECMKEKDTVIAALKQLLPQA
ncbi:hypothetical protein ABL78_7657 [Leptomonas seymouri]|uniref:Uncharacterized protein n=1 Tax=Leptomonas seymouri TaxID=5684 RepID=A0A0N0P370_LEPSE|nr:hypothetical protein ABL78_7657 [Leptomonas seymouri]|eukprot:KPI83317.1 hypothetical protein ABL78_7657 [Leptomonas seymouri]